MISFDLGTMWFETRILSLYPFFTLRCAETCLRFELSFERCRVGTGAWLGAFGGREGPGISMPIPFRVADPDDLEVASRLSDYDFDYDFEGLDGGDGGDSPWSDPWSEPQAPRTPIQDTKDDDEPTPWRCLRCDGQRFSPSEGHSGWICLTCSHDEFYRVDRPTKKVNPSGAWVFVPTSPGRESKAQKRRRRRTKHGGPPDGDEGDLYEEQAESEDSPMTQWLNLSHRMQDASLVVMDEAHDELFQEHLFEVLEYLKALQLWP